MEEGISIVSPYFRIKLLLEVEPTTRPHSITSTLPQGLVTTSDGSGGGGGSSSGGSGSSTAAVVATFETTLRRGGRGRGGKARN